MRLLLMDILLRRKWSYLIACLYFTGAFSTSSFAGVVMGLSIGTMLASALDSREVLYLPVSRREIWRTRWILALLPFILSVLVRMMVLGIAMAISQPTEVGPTWLLPSSAFQLIYIGSMFAAYIPISRHMPNFGSPVRRLLAGVALVLAAITLGVLIEQTLPKQWHELTGGAIFMLAIGLCLTVISFFHKPRTLPRRVIPLVRVGEQSGRSSNAGKPDLKTRYMRTGHTGLNLLVRSQIRTVLFVSVLCGIASQLPVVIGGWWGPKGLSILERGTVFFNPIPTGAAIFFATPVIFAAIWIFMAPDILGLRRLRTLPLTTRTLAAMLTLIPMLFWVTYWIFPLAAYWMLAGQLPSTLRLDLLAGLTGLTCMASAAGTQEWLKGPAQIVVLPLLAFAGFSALHFYGAPLNVTVTSVIGILGWIAVAVSFVLHDRALQLNGSAYISKLRLPRIGQQRWIVQ